MRRVVLALLALAVFLPSLAEARARWMTDVDLYVRHECCCPPKKAERPPVRPTLQRVCCTLDKRSAMALPPASAPSADAMPAVAAVAIATVPVLPPLRDERVSIDARAQAPPLPHSLLSQFRGLLL